ncbi:MAG: formylglycine-generating enzyme family protein [Planctomycetota bacterium]|nr:formylglycine-generating enzyme family protein [Planctomycetota bacterium]
MIINSIGMPLARIPAGEFIMGVPASEKGSTPPEQPQHCVKFTRPFYLGIYEVTQAEFQLVLERNPSEFQSVEGQETGRFPVDSVCWDDAVEFCGKLSEAAEERRAGRVYRLPTEAEWEYSCRAGTATVFHFGNSASAADANFDGQHPYGGKSRGPSPRRTATVGSYQPNAFGLCDMHGNVNEWCADWFQKGYYQSSPDNDPPGPMDGELYGVTARVLRGGGWTNIGMMCRSGERHYDPSTRRYHDYGFRVACSITELNSD